MTEVQPPWITRLERYTRHKPTEVLLVTVIVAGELDQVAIFRGFSSSLVRSTAFDPDVPVLPENAEIIGIDRLRGPYNPARPDYLEQGLTWDGVSALLEQLGI